MGDLRKDCHMRHENGNCTVTGGFCTSINDPVCEALHHAYNFGYREAASKEKIMPDDQRPLTVDELREMAGEPV